MPEGGRGGTRGHMEGVVVAQHSLMIEGFVLIKGRPGNGFVAGLLSKGSDVKFLPRRKSMAGLAWTITYAITLDGSIRSHCMPTKLMKPA